jgi:muconolactone delta-isomerase
MPEMAKMLSDLQDYAKSLHAQKKLEHYYHVVGKHGGAWICNVETNEELEIMLAKMAVHNYSSYEVYPLSEMNQ